MQTIRFLTHGRALAVAIALVALAGPVSVFAASGAANADPGGGHGNGHASFTPGDLLVTTGVWTNDADITAGSTQLPPNLRDGQPHLRHLWDGRRSGHLSARVQQ